MYYVIFADWQPRVGREKQEEARRRRVEWDYPAGVRPIVELWIATGSPAVVTVVEAEDPARITAIKAAWDDVFKVTVSPAMTPDEGLGLEAEALEEWHQQQADVSVLRPMSH